MSASTDYKRRQITGRGIPVTGNDIDTDRIIPARFLKAVVFEGLGEHAFEDARKQNPEHPFNSPAYKGASVLVVGQNFGCGSSREHAPWALVDHGFRAVISTRVADIFRNNALKNGLLPVVLEPAAVAKLVAAPGEKVTIDLEAQAVTLPDGSKAPFTIDGFSRYCLMNGVDELGFLLSQEEAIAKFESKV